MSHTIILATQRTGSTLLCSEFSAIGGLGRPGEHLLAWLKSAEAQARLTDAALDALEAEARDTDGQVGHKIMADYLPELAARWSGTADPAPEAQAAFLGALTRRLGRTAFFRIRRGDRLDQAISRYLAAETGVYFKASDGTVQTDPEAGGLTEDAAVEGLDIARIERLLGRIGREEAALDAVTGALDHPVLDIAYGQLARERCATLRACCAHAGVPAPARFSERWMEKVVGTGLRQRMRGRVEELWRSARRAGRPLPQLTDALAPGAG